MHIRYATAGDDLLLAELGARTFRDTFEADNTPEDIAAYLAEAFGREKQARELSEIDTCFLIAEIDGVAAGYVRLLVGSFQRDVACDRPVEIARLYATKEWLGRGVGAALMQAAMREGVRRGCDVIWLGVWERNQRAIAFYRKCGFEVVGSQPFQLGSDVQTDLVMSRLLQD